MNCTGAIFDLDGTLLDSMWIWHEVDQKYLLQKGKTPETDLSRKLAAKNMAQSVEYFQTVYDIDEPAEQMAAELWSMAEYAYRSLAPLKSHAYTFLRELKRRKIRSVVATASDKQFAKAALDRLGVLDCICGIVTCDEIGLGKDHPDVYFAAEKLLGLPREQIVVFEDALHAIQTAKNAGFSVAALYEPSAKADWEQIKQLADWSLYSFLDWNFEKE